MRNVCLSVFLDRKAGLHVRDVEEDLEICFDTLGIGLINLTIESLGEGLVRAIAAIELPAGMTLQDLVDQVHDCTDVDLVYTEAPGGTVIQSKKTVGVITNHLVAYEQTKRFKREVAPPTVHETIVEVYTDGSEDDFRSKYMYNANFAKSFLTGDLIAYGACAQILSKELGISVATIHNLQSAVEEFKRR